MVKIPIIPPYLALKIPIFPIFFVNPPVGTLQTPPLFEGRERERVLLNILLIEVGGKITGK